MNTKKFTLKFILTSIISIVLIIMANAGIICLKTQTASVSADSSDMLKIDLTNESFNESTKSSYPYNPTGFTAASGNDSKKAGVINLEHADYTNKFTNAKRGNNYDNYVLMLESDSTVNYGFETSSSNSISIKANSHYMVSVDVYTETDANIASLYLFDNDSEFASITNINQHITWGTYYFLISTNDLDSYSLTLGMYLNNPGTALFDNISVWQLSEQQLLSTKQTLISKSLPYVHKQSDNNIVASYKIEGGNYVNTANSSDKTNFTAFDYNLKENTSEYTSIKQVADSDGSNSYALLLENTSKTYIKYATSDNFITFKQGSVYKVSVNVKTKNLDGNANLQLIRTGADKDDASKKDSSVIKITSNTSSDKSVTNGYQTYSFYVYSDPTKDTTYKLAFGLGDNETATKGSLYINSLTISQVLYSNYSSASGSTSSKLDLVDHYAYSSTSSLPLLNNANFDAYQIADLEKPFPASPSDWEVKTGKGSQLYGVINTSNKQALTAHNLYNLNIPAEGSNNNLLMLHNTGSDTLSYKSKTKELKANSYNKFDIKVNTQHATLKVALVTTKDDSEIELVSKTVQTTLENFETVSLYLHTGAQDLDVALKVTMESTGYGYAYVDEARFNYILAPTENQFNKVIEGDFIAKADLSNLLKASNGKPNFFVEAGSINDMTVINFNDLSAVKNYVSNSNLENFTTGISAEEVIVIHSADETNYSLTSTLGFDVEESSYYKLTLDVFTQNIDTSIEDADKTIIVAGFKLNGYTNNFSNINTNEQWNTYTLYVDPTSSSTVYLELFLGSEEALTKGDVFFTNVNFTKLEDMTAETFADITESDTTRVLVAENADSDTDTEEETTETETKEKEPINKSLLLYSISAILFGVAIVIAIVGVLVRKIKWKKPVKKSKNEYDRNRTVSKQVYTRKATTEREAKLRELNKDLETITEERTKFEEQYKLDLSKLRELKIKRAPASEIAKLEKEMKKNQKTSASLGLTMNKIKNDIEYAKTDAYLQALMKKLAREAAQQTAQPKEEPKEEAPKTKTTKKSSSRKK